MRSERARWWEGLACGAVVVACILCSFPYAEMGFIDDWSYVKTAFEYARTGHFVYNGWATAMLGWQVPWGALFAKMFGHTFSAVRASMLPVALASVWLFFALLVRFGITRRNAVFGALMLGLSPLFVPLAASYMTDVSGLLVLLLCMYLCRRSLDAATERAALLWLATAALSNVAGGTVRQIAWLGALVMVPSTAWLLPRRWRAMSVAALLWLVSAASIYACLRWWQHQPYSVPESILQGAVTPAMFAHLLAELLKAALCLCLLTLPLLAAWISRFPTLTRKSQAAITLVLLLLAGWAFFLQSHGALEFRVVPWLGHILGTESIFAKTGEMLGSRPVTLNLFARALISLIVVAAALTFFFDLCVSTARKLRPDAITGSWNTMLVMFAPFTLAYVLFLVPRGLYSSIYDRYLLELLPVAILCLLKLYQERISSRLALSSYAALAVFSVYTVAATHDWFALNRARVNAVNEVHNTGVPFTHIQGGFDYDGWTQVSVARSIRWDRVRIPAGVPHSDPPRLNVAKECVLNFAQYTPAVEPQYFVVFSDMPCLATSQFGPVRYSTWLPPFQRSIQIQRLPKNIE